jgi:hypothetical protein
MANVGRGQTGYMARPAIGTITYKFVCRSTYACEKLEL